MCNAIGSSAKEESMLHHNRKCQVAIYSGIEDLNGWRQSDNWSRLSSMSNAHREPNKCGVSLDSN